LPKSVMAMNDPERKRTRHRAPIMPIERYYPAQPPETPVEHSAAPDNG